ncbi:MAG: hypothetical protein IJ700_06545 [Bacteroidaceae bacterium]|nr:hypothetical protein [Bacteroidaceae bacterium]
MAARNPFFKPSYTPEETEECFAWFRKNMDRLPATLEIDEALTTRDLRRTVGQMLTNLAQRAANSAVYSGQFAVLLQIRKCVRELPDFQESE